MKSTVKFIASVMLMGSSFAGFSQIQSSDLNFLKFREIGPATTSGRIADIAVNPTNSSEFYVAAASGGVWKTTNHGSTFSPIFDGQGSYSIGCITLDPNNSHTIWVGTGENNNQRSVAYGDGVYKSTNGGKSFTNVGLKKSEHIGMIKVHPQNSDVVFVAAYGPLWSEGGERGLYKTIDGGKTWNKIFELDQFTGVSEVHFDPRDATTMYITTHQRMRKVYTYVGGGNGSGIFKSTNGGESFNELKTGLPVNKMGRIGMAVSPVNPDVVYAVVEAQGNAGGFFKSTDRGESFSKVNKYKTSGNYYQEIYCDPVDVDKVFFMDTYAHVTYDGGKTIKRLGEKNKHVDNHCMWINPENTNHYLMGCDGGLYETYDNAKTWKYYPNLPITQFYKVVTDNSKPFYYVYGGTQDNFSLGGPSRTLKQSGIDNYDWFVTQEGDGFESAVDPENTNIVYAQAQYGWLARYDRASGQRVPIKPQPSADEAAYRWNWDAPLLISPHQAQTLYFAANKVFKSTDRGNTWEVISPDLTQQIDRNTLPVMGSVPSVDAVMKNRSTTIYGNIVSLSESPIKAGLLYAGTDDGLIQVTTNDGEKWTKIDGLSDVPPNTYVNDVKASLHDEKVAYAVFNNHKNGDFKPYIYKTTNQGKSWTPITNGLPERGSVYCIVEDHVNPDLLFAGTEFGVHVSIDGGKNWMALKGGLPTIAVRDMDVQREHNDLVLATFGRGFWVLDDYSALRGLSADVKNEKAIVLPNRAGLVYFKTAKYGYRPGGFQGATFYNANNPKSGAEFTFFVKEVPKTAKETRQGKEADAVKENADVVYPSAAQLRLEETEVAPYFIFVITDFEGNEIKRFTKKAKAGMQTAFWDGKWSDYGIRSNKNPLSSSGVAHVALPGTYHLKLMLMHNELATVLVEDHAFELQVLNSNTLEADAAKVLVFQKKLNELERVASGVNQFYKTQQERVKQAMAAVRVVPSADVKVLEKLHAIQMQQDSISIALYGDQALGKHQFEIAPGIMDRIGLAAWSSWSNQNETTQIQSSDYEMGYNGLKSVIADLKQINIELSLIENKLNQEGAPFLKAVLPELN